MEGDRPVFIILFVVVLYGKLIFFIWWAMRKNFFIRETTHVSDTPKTQDPLAP